MSTEDLLRQYQGHIVPQTYNAGFVALSYVVSLVGAASTLELINRRTHFMGIFNHLLLVSSAITMGGISIWCMHFIGNRAIDLANGERELQVAYSSGFTAISFFVPIIVLLAAFVAVGTNDAVSWWRILIGGVLCGAAVCGMHYLGNRSIQNYVCTYNPAFVVGAAIIAVVASIIALSTFFIFRAVWANSWWKRTVSAFILAGAVSGMHWCAAVGTRYRLVNIKTETNEPSRSATVIVVICLSLGACFILAGSAIFRTRNMRKSALRAQQITLGAAVFDKHGRILVDPDGFVPSAAVTDSFLEKNAKERFGNDHPLFHWMFQASRNWSGISSLLAGMRHHLLLLPRSGRDHDAGAGIQLSNEHGEIIDNYDIIFRELFCLAAMTLAERLNEDITSVGFLWDEILSTGAFYERPQARMRKSSRNPGKPEKEEDNRSDEDQSGIDMSEKGLPSWQQGYGRGSLMFLVRRVETDRDADRLTSAGYRFAELHQVSDSIRTNMQIRSPDFESTLRSMATFSTQETRVSSGVHLGFFAVRARVDNSRGFEVLVRKGARNLLPSVGLQLETVQRWHVDFLRQLEGMPVSSVVPQLFDADIAPESPRAEAFARQLGEAIRTLRNSIKDPLFEDAVLSSTIVRLPCHDDQGQAETAMITLQLVVPIHSVLSTPDFEFVSLGVLKMHQVSEQYHQAFTRGVHQEFGPIVKSVIPPEDFSREGHSRLASLVWPFRRSKTVAAIRMNDKSMATVARRRVSSDSARSSSTINLCPPGSGMRAQSVDTVDESGMYPSSDDSRVSPPSYGGILVFQEVTVNIEKGDLGSGERQYPGTSESQEAIVAEGTHGSRNRSSVVGIELQPMGRVVTDVHVGAQVSSNVEVHSGDMSSVLTFVDILFAESVKRHH
ncbi:hypothetical protein BGZ61DRAFT_396378 [Ilyonectria robusta]|uniref:uncharacterized protein n=1 Tax=Ilyonectria robusta TaxID=1079257 RepID=UPI001E8ECAAC|nr:uncharacterized protein BGZ61DRAFT_396378 [Ilyonectria robusta]KAH8679444.1 hypothetical protein BGZ61DRAFT_396378 [Ilyonectria robusta]